MKYALVIFCSIIFCSCGGEKNYPKAENALDAAREFIDACLKGNFEKATSYMTDDGNNKQLLLRNNKRTIMQKVNQKKMNIQTHLLLLLKML